MKTTLLGIACCLCCSVTHAQTTAEIMETLAEELARSQMYIDQRLRRIDSLTALYTKAADTEARYRSARRLYDEYADFQMDSAFHYLMAAEKAAEEIGDKDRLDELKILNAWCYMQDGDVIHPMQFMEKMDISQSPDWVRRSYYNTKVRIYNVLLETIRDEQTRRDYYRRLNAYLDSAYTLSPQSWLLQTDVMANRGHLAAAVDTVVHRLSDPANARYQGIAYSFLARINRQMNKPEEQKRYLALSAIADIRSGVREYKSLAELAVLLFEQGDNEHAFHYITRSMRDASTCNSKLRMVQIAEFMPVITAAYDKQEVKTKTIYRWFILGVVAFLLALVVGTWFLIRKNMALHTAHRRLDRSNQMLKEANVRLSDLNNELRRLNDEQAAMNERLQSTNKVRAEYVLRFIRLCHEYLAKREAYRKYLNKVAAKRNFDELYEAVRSTRYIDEEIEAFYDEFDEAFLRIYPAFVEKFNALLRPEEHIQLKEGERLNTDLRIFALLRIGITDTNQVCDFLRCSSSTFYNYRAKMRNRAINRDTFEADVMAIT